MSFDALAPHYRWMEFVLAGNKLQRCRIAFLARVAGARNVLILGEGNGRFLTACCRALPTARITCIDGSAAMLTHARDRLRRQGLALERIEFVHADALVWPPPQAGFDLVVTHFFLDCFSADELSRLIATITKAATREAAWLIADFQVPPGGLSRFRALATHRLMYLFFRAAAGLSARTLVNPDHFLQTHGFVLRARQVTEWGLLRTDWWVREANPTG